MTIDLERDLVADCKASARTMGAYLLCVGQRRAKGSGTTVGFPDLVLVCNGHVELIECKRPATDGQRGGVLTRGQGWVIDLCAEQGVGVHVIETVREFEAIVNSCRRPAGVRR